MFLSDVNRGKLMYWGGRDWLLTTARTMIAKLLDRIIFYSEDKYV